MTNDEMQKTVEFILTSHAQFAADAQALKDADARAIRRIERMESTVKLLIRAGRRERKDLREKFTALVDAQSRTEDRLDEFIESTDDRVNALIAMQLRADERHAAFESLVGNTLAQMAAGNEARDQALAEMMRAITKTSQRVDAIEENGTKR